MQRKRGRKLRWASLTLESHAHILAFFVQEQATHIRTEHAALQAQLLSAQTSAERLTLRLEDAQAVLAEKERLNSDIQQEKAALKVQVGKWKSLDDRDGNQLENLHKQRVVLEGQVKRLESQLAEEEGKVSAQENAIQKEQKKVEKLQRALEEQSVRTCAEIPGSTLLILSYSVSLRRQKPQ